MNILPKIKCALPWCELEVDENCEKWCKKHYKEVIKGARAFKLESTLICPKCNNSGICSFLQDEYICVNCGKVEIDMKNIKNNPSNLNISESDNVNHPSHYNRGKVECIDALESAASSPEGFQDHCRLTAIKYLYRAGAKNNALEDAKKAIWYINRYIKSLEDKNENSNS